MKTNVFTYVFSFLFGAAAGAVVALLNAPQSGKRTRAQLRNEIADARYRTRKAINKAQAHTMDRVEDIQERVQELGDEAVQQTRKLELAFQQVAEKPKAVLGRAR
jgi:gas vesicle protein